MTRMPFILLSTLLATNAYSELPVILTGPSSPIPGQVQPGFNQTFTYTVINNVPRMSAPLTVSGLSGPVTRIPVANDCGDVLPSGPSSCNIGILIEPQPANFGFQFQRTLLIDYQDRVPLKSNIEFTVSSEPALLLAAGNYYHINNPSLVFPFVATSTNGSGTDWSVKPSSVEPGIFVTSSCVMALVNNILTPTCVVLGTGQQTYVSEDGGSTFVHNPAFFPPNSNLVQSTVSCAGNDAGLPFCIAAAQNVEPNSSPQYFISTTDINAKHFKWVIQFSLVGTGVITNSSCSGNGANTACVFVGYNKANVRGSNVFMLSTPNAGGGGDGSSSGWSKNTISTPKPSSRDVSLNSVSCTGFGTTANCVAVGGFNNTSTPLLYNTLNGGTSWSPGINVPKLFYNSVSCTGYSGNLVCAAVGNSSTIAISNDGVHWRSVPSSGSAATQLLSVSCTGSGNTAVCAAGGTASGVPVIVVSNNGGNTWFTPTYTPPATATQFTTVSCTQDGPSSICIAGSNQVNNQLGSLLQSVNSGATWTPVAVAGLPANSQYRTSTSTE